MFVNHQIHQGLSAYFQIDFYHFSVCLSVLLSLDRFCQYDSVTTVQDIVMKLYSCVVEIKASDEFEDRCGLTHEY